MRAGLKRVHFSPPGVPVIPEWETAVGFSQCGRTSVTVTHTPAMVTCAPCLGFPGTDPTQPFGAPIPATYAEVVAEALLAH